MERGKEPTAGEVRLQLSNFLYPRTTAKRRNRFFPRAAN